MNNDNKIYKLCLVFIILLLSGLAFVSVWGINQTEKQNSYFVVDNSGYKTIFNSKPTRVLCYNLTYDTILLGIVPADYLVAKITLTRIQQFRILLRKQRI